MITRADLDRLRMALELGASAPELMAVAEEIAFEGREAERERRKLSTRRARIRRQSLRAGMGAE